MTIKSLVPVVPCALQSYVQRQGRHGENSDLSPLQCQIVFQNWVAYDRNCSLEIDKKERLICPLLCCRSELEDVSSCLRHLLNCPWLSNAWYWCPHCHRPELFIYGEDGVQRRVQRKESKLRRAVTFFKQFRRKTFSHAKQRTPPSLRPKKIYELDDSSDQTVPKLPELPVDEPTMSLRPLKTHDTIGWLDQKHNLNRVGRIEDAPNTSALTSSVQKYSPAPIELSSAIPLVPAFRYELLASDLPKDYQGSRVQGLSSSPSNLAPIGVDLGTDVDGSADCSLVSPLSAFGMRQDYSTINEPINVSHSLSPHSSFGMGNSKQDDQSDGSLSPRAPSESSEPCKTPLQTFEASGDLFSHENLSTQSLVQDLRSSIRFFSDHWLIRLRSALGNIVVPFLPTTDTLFEIGHRALKQIYEGVLPCTFAEVFSMMHIVIASAYILHHSDASFAWDNLIHHVTRWHRAIIDSVEKDLFLNVANVLWSPPEFLKTFNLANSYLYHVPMPLFHVGQTLQISNGQGLTKESHNSMPRSMPERPTMKTLRLSTKGPVIEVCSEYLNLIEYANTYERKDLKVSKPSGSLMANFIHTSLIEPLMFWNDTETLQDYVCEPMSNVRDKLFRQIEEASIMVQNGLLENVREVEVRLVSGCKLEYTGHKRENHFLETVISLSDAAMSSEGLTWRDRHYATDLDLVLAVSLELDKKERREGYSINQMKPLDTALEFHDSSLPSYSSPSSASSGSASSFFGSTSDFTDSASIFTDSTHWAQEPFSPSTISELDSYRSKTQPIPNSALRASSSNFPSPIPLESSASSPLELPAPVPQELPASLGLESRAGSMPSLLSRQTKDPEPCYCGTCGKAFHGLDRISNRQRHFTYSHTGKAPSTCPFPSCGKPFSRPDNMMKHHRKQHLPDSTASTSTTTFEGNQTES